MLRLLLLLTIWSGVNAVNAQQPKAAPSPYNDHVDLSYFYDAFGRRRSIESKSDWMQRRQQILADMQLIMGPLPSPETPVVLDLKVHEETKTANYIRQLVSYHTDSKSRRVRAYLFSPPSTEAPRAAVLCLHQTTTIGKKEPAGL